MKKGEIWKVRHARKGEFTCRLMEDVPEGGGDIDVEIVAGEVAFLSAGVRTATAGDVIRIRTSVTTFLERVK